METSEYLPHIAYDTVIIGFSGTDLKILIMEYHNTGLFALPGGFVKKNESLDIAVRLGLEERTGLRDIYLEQFCTFGDIERYKPDVMESIMKANGHEPKGKLKWLLDRFISVAYYALINYKNVIPTPDVLSDSCQWYSLKKLPKLILDHRLIVDRAVYTLRDNLDKKLVGGNLLPKRFTMKDLQQVYEAILGVKLRRTTFQRQILSLNILKRHGKVFSGEAHKAPYHYSFKKLKKM